MFEKSFSIFDLENVNAIGEHDGGKVNSFTQLDVGNALTFNYICVNAFLKTVSESEYVWLCMACPFPLPLNSRYTDAKINNDGCVYVCVGMLPVGSNTIERWALNSEKSLRITHASYHYVYFRIRKLFLLQQKRKHHLLAYVLLQWLVLHSHSIACNFIPD